MAAIEEVDRGELVKRIDAVIEEFHRRHGRLPRRVQVLAKSDTGQQREWAPTSLADAVDVTAGSRIVANQLAAKLHQEQPHLSFQECVSKVFTDYPALYESECAQSRVAQQRQYDGLPS